MNKIKMCLKAHTGQDAHDFLDKLLKVNETVSVKGLFNEKYIHVKDDDTKDTLIQRYFESE